VTILLQACAHSQQVAGSTWSGRDIWGKPLLLYFADDGTIVYKTSSGIWPTGTWRQDRAQIFFEMNDQFVEHKGDIREDEMGGEGWTKGGKKGSWSLKRQPTNIDALIQAKSAAQVPAGPPGLLTPSEYEGRFEADTSIRSDSVTIRLLCMPARDCRLDLSTVGNEGKTTTVTSRIKDVHPVTNWVPILRAFQYARTNRGDRPRNEEHATIQNMLRPLLSSDATVDRCVDLNLGGDNASVLCRPSASPWDTPVLLLFAASTGACGDGFCQYLIYPLLRR
jgi:hypothetical protein